MTKEQYVSFETSQLLKAKGFDWEVRSLYGEEGDMGFSSWSNNYNLKDDLFSAPTIQMALRWLKETHGLWVIPMPCENGGFYFEIYKRCGKIWKDNVYDHTEYEDYDEPEYAIEGGLNYCLTNIV